MPSSRLYNAAVTALGPRGTQWQQAALQLAAIVGSDPNEDGSGILEAIQSEHRLCADPATPDPTTVMSPLLGALCSLFPVGSDLKAFQAAFDLALRPYSLQGPAIAARPGWLFRYVNGQKLVESIARSLRGPTAISDASDLRAAIDDASRGDCTWDVVARVIHDLWDSIPPDFKLSYNRSTFVTFDGAPVPAQRLRASWIHSALGLWVPPKACFLEVRIASRPGDQLLFPTIADAGWSPYFRSAHLGELHGWTKPHHEPTHRQPEAVLDHPDIARVARGNLKAVGP